MKMLEPSFAASSPASVEAVLTLAIQLTSLFKQPVSAGRDNHIQALKLALAQAFTSALNNTQSKTVEDKSEQAKTAEDKSEQGNNSASKAVQVKGPEVQSDKPHLPRLQASHSSLDSSPHEAESDGAQGKNSEVKSAESINFWNAESISFWNGMQNDLACGVLVTARNSRGYWHRAMIISVARDKGSARVSFLGSHILDEYFCDRICDTADLCMWPYPRPEPYVIEHMITTMKCPSRIIDDRASTRAKMQKLDLSESAGQALAQKEVDDWMRVAIRAPMAATPPPSAHQLTSAVEASTQVKDTVHGPNTVQVVKSEPAADAGKNAGLSTDDDGSKSPPPLSAISLTSAVEAKALPALQALPTPPAQPSSELCKARDDMMINKFVDRFTSGLASASLRMFRGVHIHLSDIDYRFRDDAIHRFKERESAKGSKWFTQIIDGGVILSWLPISDEMLERDHLWLDDPASPASS